MRYVALDNEAVQALFDPRHRKHVIVSAHIVAVAGRRRRNVETKVVVPTSVRVQAGWDRKHRDSAALNLLRVLDLPLDTATADRAALLRRTTGVSVADCHLGAVLQELSQGGEVAVITSDPADIARVAGNGNIRIVQV